MLTLQILKDVIYVIPLLSTNQSRRFLLLKNGVHDHELTVFSKKFVDIVKEARC